MFLYRCDVVGRLGQERGKEAVVLDLGCGPSICNILAASTWSRHIYLADLLEGNRSAQALLVLRLQHHIK
jgi:hypothetical protein